MAVCAPATTPAWPVVQKAVGAVLNYGFDLAPAVPQTTNQWATPMPVPVPWLALGETVLTLNVTSDGGTPTGTANIVVLQTTITANSVGVPGSLLTAWISGGTAGTVYNVSFVWTTNSTPIARQDERTIQLAVVQYR